MNFETHIVSSLTN